MKKVPIQPAPRRVKIIESTNPYSWYRNKVGEEFDVDLAGGNYDYVLWEDLSNDKARTYRHIKKSDCEVVY